MSPSIVALASNMYIYLTIAFMKRLTKWGAKQVPSFKSIGGTSSFLKRVRCQLLAISNSAEDHVVGDNDPVPCGKICRVAEEATQSNVKSAAAKHGLSERSVKRLIEAHAHTVF